MYGNGNGKRKGLLTLRERAMAMPTINKKKGMTKSARLQPFQGACPIIGHSSPASSTKIINYKYNTPFTTIMTRFK